MQDEDLPMMMKMKYVRHGIRTAALALCALTLTAVSAIAQDNGAPPPPPQDQMGHGGFGGPRGHHDPAQMEQHQLEMMTKHLKLTPEQVTQVKAIDDAQRTQMMAMRDDTSTPREDKRAKMMAMRQDRDSKIRSVLTPDQQPKYDEMLAKQKERMAEHHGGHDGAAPPPPAL